MNYKPFIVGAASVATADLLYPKLPATLDVGGLPLRSAGSAFAGAYAASYFTSGKPGLMKTAITTVVALIAAELAMKVAPDKDFLIPVTGHSLKRVAAGALGAFGASYLNKSE